MRISLRYFEALLTREYGSARTVLRRASRIPQIRSVSVLAPGIETSQETLYVDFLPRGPERSSLGASVVTCEARAPLFDDCDLIVLPNSADLFTVSGYLTDNINRVLAWADDVYEAIAQNADLQIIIDMTAKLLRQPMYVCDSTWRMLAQWGGEIEYVNPTWSYQIRYKYLPFQVMQEIVEADDLSVYQKPPHVVYCDHRPGFPSFPFLSKAIRKNGVYYGNFFVLEFYRKLDAVDYEIAEFLGTALSSALSGNRNYIEMNAFYHAHFVEDIIEGTLTDRHLIRDQLNALSWSLDGDYRVALLDSRQDNRAVCHYMMLSLEQESGVLNVMYKGYVLAVFSKAGEHDAQITRALKGMAKNYDRNVGLSERFNDFATIASYFRQAEHAVLEAEKLGIHGKFFLARRFFLDYVASAFLGEFPQAAPICRLQRHDEAHGTELCRTLYAWLRNNCNIAQTAKVLFIHRNTCKNRIEALREVLDCDLGDDDVRIELVLGLHALGREAGWV